MAGDLYFFSIDFFFRDRFDNVSNRSKPIRSISNTRRVKTTRCEFFADRDTSRTCRGTVINLLTEGPERVRMNRRGTAV